MGTLLYIINKRLNSSNLTKIVNKNIFYEFRDILLNLVANTFVFYLTYATL